jgi:hypothetical protein
MLVELGLSDADAGLGIRRESAVGEVVIVIGAAEEKQKTKTATRR